MSENRTTLIISDLHVGGGSNDAGDDHIYQNGELVRFLRTQAATPEGAQGRIELVFNGDFLEFAQTNQAAFGHPSDDYWCSEKESMDKLETILDGHADIFRELVAFQAAGNLVTIAAGNHDVDLYWPDVQARLRQAAGSALRYELGKEWYERYSSRLQISHGHMRDPANTFAHWDNPIRTDKRGTDRLEMCPGTLFMVKFVNKLENKYPFADNLLPVTKLASVLLKDDKAGFGSIAWTFTRFTATTSLSTLSAQKDAYGDVILEKIRSDHAYAARIGAAMTKAGLDRDQTDGLTQQRLADRMFRLLGRISDQEWRELFDAPFAATLGSDPKTLHAIARSNSSFDKAFLRNLAQERLDSTEAEVVVMGHTHQPDRMMLDGGIYYNPGCWTRYLELNPGQEVRLADLVDESKYPYELNFVKIWSDDVGAIKSDMICFEKGG